MDRPKIFELGVEKYDAVMSLQEELRTKAKYHGTEYLIACQHHPVITYGRLANFSNLLVPPEELEKFGIQLVRTNRGGDFTYHGPGMLVIYPVINLRDRGMDCITYLRILENIVIRSLNNSGIRAFRVENCTGVWCSSKSGPRKICSIGIHISQGVAIHGFCLNLKKTPPFGLNLINPCGFKSNSYCFVEDLAPNVTFEEIREKVISNCLEVLWNLSFELENTRCI
ncbi:MAG: lipoyl(octanoyl) transferase LipB [Deltaproteobacteria bacterium]|nr:lipoyl(octanoyl) transferase LipB [Deltaproteobacteria bacterium]